MVYKLTRPDALNNQYIGETKRQLLVKIKNHVTKTNSIVLNDIGKCGFCKNYNTFIIFQKL